MVAGHEQRRHGADRGHAGCEGEPLSAALDRREVALERFPRRVLRARVLVALVPAERFLHVGGRLVDRRDDRAGRWIRFLPGVQAQRAESRVRRELHDLFTIHALITRSPRPCPPSENFRQVPAAGTACVTRCSARCPAA